MTAGCRAEYAARDSKSVDHAIGGTGGDEESGECSTQAQGQQEDDEAEEPESEGRRHSLGGGAAPDMARAEERADQEEGQQQEEEAAERDRASGAFPCRGRSPEEVADRA